MIDQQERLANTQAAERRANRRDFDLRYGKTQPKPYGVVVAQVAKATTLGTVLAALESKLKRWVRENAVPVGLIAAFVLIVVVKATD